MSNKRLGLIVNPIAGIGGRVGLKGSDGFETQERARQLGARPIAQERAAQALEALMPLKEHLELFTPPCEMGEWTAQKCGFLPRLVCTDSALHSPTTAQDTIHAAQALLEAQVDLLLFAGGDGTARDIYTAVGGGLPVLGIPAGVKIYSAVFGITPQCAGELVAEFLSGTHLHLHEAEVIDLDEDAYRQGQVSTRLYGYLRVPYRRHLVQNQKIATPASEAAQASAIAAEVIERMIPTKPYILGPGTTPRAVAEQLGLPKTLVGVDLITRERVIALDVNEQQILDLLECQPAGMIITPIGGQGFLFGRGNQPISPSVIQKVGKENVMVISLPGKIAALRGRPLLMDCGDPQVDQRWKGYLEVITGYHERIIYRVA